MNYSDNELLPETPPEMLAQRPTYGDLKEALKQLRELRLENERLRTAMRPSLEVLQRMANGIDQFDRGRFQCAVAALPHETPKLSATVGITGQLGGIGDQLDRARQRRIDASGLRVITDQGP